MITSHGPITADMIGEIRQLESASGLAVTEKQIRPTVKFLRSLATALTLRWRRRVTPTQAWQVWHLLFAIEERLQRETQQHAEIASWFNVDPFALSDEQMIGLLANVGKVKAQHRIESGNFDPDDFEGVFNLVLLATGDERQALAARSQSIQHAARRGEH